MLMNVARSDVTLGMFVHGFEGSWLSHPFWFTRFLLTDAVDLQRIRDSDVAGVIIDVHKGAAPPVQAIPAGASRQGASRQGASRQGASRQGAGRPGAIRQDATPGRETAGEVRSRTLATFRDPSRPGSHPAESPAAIARRRTRQLITRSASATSALFENMRFGRAIQSEDVIGIVDDIAASVEAHRSMIADMTRLKARDHCTYVHSVAVCALMVNVARELGFDDRQRRDLGMAGLLHDIGKSTIDQAVLTKPSSLNAAEAAEMRRHPRNGYDMLAGVRDIPDVVRETCLGHHERIDGSGYPDGLMDGQISIPVRLVAICDVYDALTSDRPYRAALSPATAIADMAGQEDKFDRVLLFAFMKSIGVFPADMLVRMRSNQLAIVLRTVKPNAPTTVRIFWSIADHALIDPCDLVPSQDLLGDQIVSRERPETWGLTGWDEIRTHVLNNRFGRKQLIRG